MEFAVAPHSGSSITESRLDWNLEVLVFVEGGKSEILGKTLEARTRTNYRLNPAKLTLGPGIKPRPH